MVDQASPKVFEVRFCFSGFSAVEFVLPQKDYRSLWACVILGRPEVRMSQERRERQKERGQRSGLSWADKHWPTIRNWLIGLALTDVILDAIKGKIKEALVGSLRGYAVWILVNPFALLTVGVIVLLILLFYKVVDGYFEARREARPGFASHIPTDRKYRPHFLAQSIVTIFLCILAVGFGSYYTYAHPMPPNISASKAWFAEKYKGSDVYAVIRLRNYSATPTLVTIDHYTTIGGVKGQNADPNIPEVITVTLPPWEEFTARYEMNFHGSQPLIDAYHNNGIKLHAEAKYNNGHKKVTYNVVGVMDYGSVRYCSGCEGNIDLVNETTTTD